MFGNKFMTPAQLEAEASKLSSFDGSKFESFDGSQLQAYTGRQDQFLSFEGEESFVMEGNEEKQFSINMVNANAAVRTAAIWSGYKKGNATLYPGQMTDGAFNDTSAAAGLTATSNVTGKTIEELFLYLAFNPSRLVRATISSDVESQIRKDFLIEEHNPFYSTRSRSIRPKSFQNQDTFQLKLLDFPINTQLDDRVGIKYPFAGSSDTDIVLYFGASINLGIALKRKADMSNRIIDSVGRGNVRQLEIQQKALGQ